MIKRTMLLVVVAAMMLAMIAVAGVASAQEVVELTDNACENRPDDLVTRYVHPIPQVNPDDGSCELVHPEGGGRDGEIPL